MATGEVPEVLRDRGLVAIDGAELALLARHGTGAAVLTRVEELIQRARGEAIVVLNRMGRIVEAWEDRRAALARLRLAADRKLPQPRGSVDLLDEVAARAHAAGVGRVTREFVGEVVAGR